MRGDKCRKIRNMLVLMAGMLSVWGMGQKVHGAPASLASPSAVIYESPDEGSNAVGSIVQGSQFELTGQINGEDGGLWYAVSMPGGVTGYLKGDAQIEREDNSETGEREDTEESEETGEIGEEEVRENGEEGEDIQELEKEDFFYGYSPENRQEKTYAAVDDRPRIRHGAGEDTGADRKEKGEIFQGTVRDHTPLLAAVVFAASLGGAGLGLYGLKRADARTGDMWGGRKTDRHKKKSRHKKNGKRRQIEGRAGKEADNG